MIMSREAIGQTNDFVIAETAMGLAGTLDRFIVSMEDHPKGWSVTVRRVGTEGQPDDVLHLHASGARVLGKLLEAAVSRAF